MFGNAFKKTHRPSSSPPPFPQRFPLKTLICLFSNVQIDICIKMNHYGRWAAEEIIRAIILADAESAIFKRDPSQAFHYSLSNEIKLILARAFPNESTEEHETKSVQLLSIIEAEIRNRVKGAENINFLQMLRHLSKRQRIIVTENDFKYMLWYELDVVPKSTF